MAAVDTSRDGWLRRLLSLSTGRFGVAVVLLIALALYACWRVLL